MTTEKAIRILEKYSLIKAIETIEIGWFTTIKEVKLKYQGIFNNHVSCEMFRKDFTEDDEYFIGYFLIPADSKVELEDLNDKLKTLQITPGWFKHDEIVFNYLDKEILNQLLKEGIR